MSKKIPSAIRQAFKAIIDVYGDNISLLGVNNNVEYYIYNFPDDVDAGFPQIISYHNGNITEVPPFETFKLLKLFRSFRAS